MSRQAQVRISMVWGWGGQNHGGQYMSFMSTKELEFYHVVDAIGVHVEDPLKDFRHRNYVIRSVCLNSSAS